ncbi:MAG: enoyl-CoA hydratase/isomerase family protein [Gammaproteobacteria bacterium]|nr:MAG: enoyl-CoA hydratase/isomerase family protein [Gammaproteobacteria bacterium]
MQSYNLKTSDRGIASVILNRPEQHNAFDDGMIAELIELLCKLEQDDRTRVLVLRAAGKSFSAGADLNWMRRMADYDLAQNQDDAMQLAELMRRLNCFPKPTIALVQGAAYGGGVGLVACCDIAIASPAASFCLSEVKLGLIPAVISPYVIEAIGARAARRFMLTAEHFDAEQACRLGLVHEVVEAQDLDAKLDSIVESLLAAGPAAQSAVKELIRMVSNKPIDDELIRDCAQRIARIRASGEAREGLSAFLEKRKPNWPE